MSAPTLAPIDPITSVLNAPTIIDEFWRTTHAWSWDENDLVTIQPPSIPRGASDAR